MKSILKICKIHTKYPNFCFSKKFEDPGTLGLHAPRATNQGVAAHFSWHATTSPQCPPLCHFPRLQVRVNALSSHSPPVHSFNCVGPIRTGAEKLRARLSWVGKIGKDFFFLNLGAVWSPWKVFYRAITWSHLQGSMVSLDRSNSKYRNYWMKTNQDTSASHALLQKTLLHSCNQFSVRVDHFHQWFVQNIKIGWKQSWARRQKIWIWMLSDFDTDLLSFAVLLWKMEILQSNSPMYFQDHCKSK